MLLEYPVPRSVLQIQKFFRLLGFVRRFILNFAVIDKPVHDLLRKGAKFNFGDSQQRTFEILIDPMIIEPVLAVCCCSEYTKVHTDASSRWLGAIL